MVGLSRCIVGLSIRKDALCPVFHVNVLVVLLFIQRVFILVFVYSIVLPIHTLFAYVRVGVVFLFSFLDAFIVVFAVAHSDNSVFLVG